VQYWWQTERKCKQCGDPYIPKRQTQMYCKRTCRSKYYRNHPEEIIKKGILYNKICPECGNSFETLRRQQKYCCDTCRYDINGRRKYHNDKKYAPDVHQRNRERRLKNLKIKREQALENGDCIRCLKPKHPDNPNKICDECRTKVGKNR